MVQKVLSYLSGDRISTIDEVEESEQILEIMEDKYNELLSRREWAFLDKTIQLTSASDTAKPTKFTIPGIVNTIYSLRYDVSLTADDPDWITIKYLEVQDFLDIVMRRKLSDTNVISTTNDDSIPMYLINDSAPTYYTTFDEDVIFMDSFIFTEETFQATIKTAARANQVTAFKRAADSDTQAMPGEFFPLWLAECKSQASILMKDKVDPKMQGIARTLYRTLKSNDTRVNRPPEKQTYGKPKTKQIRRDSKR